MRLERRPVDAPPSGGVTVRVPARGCWMTASATADGPRAQASDAISALPLRCPGVASAYSLGIILQADADEMVAVRTTTAEAALSASERASRIVLAKVDVEGAELHALRSLLSLMPKIDNIVIETSPGWWTERHNQARAQPSSFHTRNARTHL